MSATATDADGELASTSWLIGGAEVASGTSADLTLGDGSTTVTFRATDDDGDSTSTSVTITVGGPFEREALMAFYNSTLAVLTGGRIARVGWGLARNVIGMGLLVQMGS